MTTIPGRIPIHIHPFFWILIFMIGWLNTNTIPGTIIWAIVILISIIVHEFGHALTARVFGQEAEISLVGLGGVTTRQGASTSSWKEFLIVFNGPFAGLLLFFILFQLQPLVATWNPYFRYGIKVGIEVNLFWTLLNLLPILPLDGGHLLRILLESVFGFRGMKISIVISVLLAAILGGYFILIGQLFMGAIFFMFGFESYRAWTEVASVTSQDVNPQIQSDYQGALRDAEEGNNEVALLKLFAIREQMQSGILFTSATQEIARIYIKQGNYKQAYELLAPIRNKLSIEYLVLLQNLAYRVEEWEHAAQIGTLAYQKQPSKDVALINAMAYAIMGQAKECVGWLRCLVQQGFPNIQSVISRREFDSVRQSQEFQSWIKTL